MRYIFEPIQYKLFDVGNNIKCEMIVGGETFVFNCQTKYEDSAEEVIQKLLRLCLTNTMTFEEVLVSEDMPIYDEVCEWWE